MRTQQKKAMKSRPEDRKGFDIKYFENYEGWLVRARFTYTDKHGVYRPGSSTSWYGSFKEAEENKQRILEANGYKPIQFNESKETIKETLSEWVSQLEIDSKGEVASDYIKELLDKKKAGIHLSKKQQKTLDRFQTGRPQKNRLIDVLKRVRPLTKNYFMPSLETVKAKDIQPYHFSQWMVWINSDNVHDYLSGRSVRKYATALHDINQHLFEKGFYDQPKKDVIDGTITAVKKKPLEEGKRTNRAFPKYEDLMKISAYYKKRDNLANFEDLYWYTLFHFLFFTGMRPGEAIGLLWDWIDFKENNGKGVIHIFNSIKESDKREDVEAIYRNKAFSTKTEDSERDISMWASYRKLMRDYKQSYKYHYSKLLGKELSDKQIGSMFVFPNITARNKSDRARYQRHDNIVEELQRMCKDLNIEPDYDTQMFRHATAYFLCNDKLLKEEDCRRFFGHDVDSDMIETIYKDHDKEADRKKTDKALEDLINESDEEQFTDTVSEAKRIAKVNVKKTVRDARNNREYRQIERAIKKGQKQYYYLPEYKWLIDELPKHRPDLADKIEFIEEEEKTD